MEDNKEDSSATFAHSSQEKKSENNINNYNEDIHNSILLKSIYNSCNTQSDPHLYNVQDNENLKDNIMTHNDEVKTEEKIMINGNYHSCKISGNEHSDRLQIICVNIEEKYKGLSNINVCDIGNETECVASSNELNSTSEKRDIFSVSHNAILMPQIYDGNGETKCNNPSVCENDKEQLIEKVTECVNQATKQISSQPKKEDELNNSVNLFKSSISLIDNSQETLSESMEVTRNSHISVYENDKDQSAEVIEVISKLLNDATSQPKMEVGIKFSHEMLITEDMHNEEEKLFITDNDDQVCPVLNENNFVNILSLTTVNNNRDYGETLSEIENSDKGFVLQTIAEVPDNYTGISEYPNMNKEIVQNACDISVEKIARHTDSFEDDFKQTQQIEVLVINDKNNNENSNCETDVSVYSMDKEALKVAEIDSNLTGNILDRGYHKVDNNDEFTKEKFVVIPQAIKENYESNFMSLHERNCSVFVNDNTHEADSLSGEKNGLFDSLQSYKVQHFINSDIANDTNENKLNDEIRLDKIEEQNGNSGCDEYNPCHCEIVITTSTEKPIHDASLVTKEQKINGDLSDLSTINCMEEKTMLCPKVCENTENKTNSSVRNNTVPELLKENTGVYQFTCNGTTKGESLAVNSVTEKTVADFVLPDSKTNHTCWDTLSSSSTESDITGTGPIFGLYNKYKHDNKCLMNSENDSKQYQKMNGPETMLTAEETEKIVNNTEFNSTKNETNFSSDDELEIAIKKYENYTKDDGTQTDPLNISYLYEHRVSLKRNFPCFLIENENEFELKHKYTKILNKNISCDPDDVDNNDQDFDDTEDVDMDDFEDEGNKYVDEHKAVYQMDHNTRYSVSEHKIIRNSNKDNPCTEEAEQTVPVATPTSAADENKLLKKLPIRVGLSRLARPKKPLHYATRTLPCEG